jgi:hypothetical protein
LTHLKWWKVTKFFPDGKTELTESGGLVVLDKERFPMRRSCRKQVLHSECMSKRNVAHVYSVLPELTHTRFVVAGADVIHSYATPALGIECDAYPEVVAVPKTERRFEFGDTGVNRRYQYVLALSEGDSWSNDASCHVYRVRREDQTLCFDLSCHPGQSTRPCLLPRGFYL